MKSRSVTQDLVWTEELLARSSSKRLVLDLDCESASVTASLLLRSYRGRANAAQSVLEANGTNCGTFASELEALRNLIFTGDLNSAHELRTRMRATSPIENAELCVEDARIALLANNHEGFMRNVMQALSHPQLPDLSRMTCFQLRGDHRLQRGDRNGAISDLTLAIELANTFRNAGSAFSARAFLVQALSETARFDEAKGVIGALYDNLNNLDSVELWLDRMLTVKRGESHFYRHLQDNENLKSCLKEAHALALWVGDQTTAQKCANELAETGDRDERNSFVITFSGWTYLPGLKVILVESTKSIHRLHKSPTTLSLLNTLAQNPLALDRLFEAVWKLPYSPLRHETHIRAALSKARKLLPKGAIQVRDGVVSLT